MDFGDILDEKGNKTGKIIEMSNTTQKVHTY